MHDLVGLTIGIGVVLTACNGEESGGGGTGGAAGTQTSGGQAGALGGRGGAGGSGGCGGCAYGLSCCNGACVNPSNDFRNCGTCGHECPGPNPHCSSGTCRAPVCYDTTSCGTGEVCCGMSCCSAGELCCEIQLGPTALQCATPVNGTCPVGCPGCVCTSPDTPVATPGGPRAMATLREGDLVMSVDRGRVVAVPVRQTRRVPVTGLHTVVRVTLGTGAVLEISAPHPTADGRRFGELRAGSHLGGIEIVAVERVPYAYGFTYDLLPASDSGTYFAGEALIGSTLAPPADLCFSAAVGRP